MKLTSSYAVQLKNIDFNIMDTVKVYREAVAFGINAFNKEWKTISLIKGEHERFNLAEKLVHTTKSNKATYDFDAEFYKFPSYLRRSVIQTALGCVSSYQSNLQNWKLNPVGKEPTLTYDRMLMPTFYNKNMYLTSDNPYECRIKVYLNRDWVWKTVKFVKTDVKYIEKHLKDLSPSAPVLEKRFGTYYLRFAFDEFVSLNNTELSNRTICSVDLGLNSDAVCTIMNSVGTGCARKFINFTYEKDQLWHLCNRIKKQQRKYGPQSVKRKWSYAKYLNQELSVKIAAAIVAFAKLHQVDTIVFEHLNMQSKKSRGKYAQRLHLWRKNGIQQIAQHKAHKNGIRISRICAKNTSALAYDGSDLVVRNANNKALATFQNNKQYNCDLSASYNIGARYFIRELLKPIGVTQWSQILAKVPELERRTSCTYHTLIELNKVLAA